MQIAIFASRIHLHFTEFDLLFPSEHSPKALFYDIMGNNNFNLWICIMTYI